MSGEKREVLKVDMGASGVKTVSVDFPSNSKSSKVEVKTEERRKVEKVVSGGVIQQKKSLGKRFVETFIGEDIKNVKSYIIHDVVIPAAKDTIADIVKGITDTIQGSIEVSLFGETRRKNASRSGRDSNRPYVSYDRMSSRERDRADAKRAEYNKVRAHNSFEDIILETRQDGDAVLGALADLIVDYGQATVADLYDLVGKTGNFTDDRYGWKEIGGATVSRARGGGYLLNLPRPVLLD